MYQILTSTVNKPEKIFKKLVKQKRSSSSKYKNQFFLAGLNEQSFKQLLSAHAQIEFESFFY